MKIRYHTDSRLISAASTPMEVEPQGSQRVDLKHLPGDPLVGRQAPPCFGNIPVRVAVIPPTPATVASPMYHS